MKKQQLEILIESLAPKAYGLCFALTGNAELSQQLFVDAYTVFLIEEKEFIAEDELAPGDQEMRLSVKRYLFNTLAKYIHHLAQNKNRYALNGNSSNTDSEFREFYKLKPQTRGVLFLKEKLDLRLEDLQEIFALKRYQVVEFIHNANFTLNSNSVESRENSQVTEAVRYQVNSFVNRTLPKEQVGITEEKINSDNSIYDYFQERLRLREFTKSLIPDGAISPEIKQNLNKEISIINEDIFPKERFHAFKKISTFLTTPIIEI